MVYVIKAFGSLLFAIGIFPIISYFVYESGECPNEKRVAISCGIVGIVFFAFWVFPYSSAEQNKKEDITDRVEHVAEDLTIISAELSDIQKQLEERVEFVEQLKKDAEIAENVMNLSEEQVNAVQAKLSEELQRDSQKGFIQDIMVNIIFLLLGMLIPYIGKIILKFGKLKKKKGIKNNNKRPTRY